MNKIFFVSFLLLLGLNSCRNLKYNKVILTTSPNAFAVDTLRESLIKNISKQQITHAHITIKGKLEALAQTQTTEANFTVRMAQDSLLWASIGMFGFEGLRVLISKDSVKIINKIQDTYQEETIDYLQKTIALNVSLDDFESLLLGRCPNIFLKQNFELKQKSDSLLLNFEHEKYTLQITLNKNYHLQTLHLVDKIITRSLQINYEEYAQADETIVPFKVYIKTLNETKSSDLTLQYQKVLFKEHLEMPFKIPRKIRKKNQHK